MYKVYNSNWSLGVFTNQCIWTFFQRPNIYNFNGNYPIAFWWIAFSCDLYHTPNQGYRQFWGTLRKAIMAMWMVMTPACLIQISVSRSTEGSTLWKTTELQFQETESIVYVRQWTYLKVWSWKVPLINQNIDQRPCYPIPGNLCRVSIETIVS